MPTPPLNRPVRNWLTALVIATYVLILWGAVVRRSGSGLGCPDWPLCHGTLLPAFHLATYIEWTHRLLAGIVSLITVGTLLAIARRPIVRARLLSLGVITFALLLLQAGLGGVTVKSELQPLIVAAHLGLAWIFMSCVVVMWLRVESPLSFGVPVMAHSALLRHTSFALFIVFAQALLGAVVSTSNAGMACPDFPLCQGLWFPPMVGAVALHMTHRLGAVLALLVVGSLIWRGLRVGRDRALYRAILLTLMLQLALGVANVLCALAFAIDIAHLGVATALYLLLLIAAVRSRKLCEEPTP